jgi:tetratricopeptide (TPR) repeat protein
MMKDLFSAPLFRRLLKKRLAEGWTFKNIESMSTEEIFGHLKRLGIKTSRKKFLRAAKHYDSAQNLAKKEWDAKYTLQPKERYDADFPWMAAIVLWQRLLPDHICFEQIDRQMQEGYDLLMSHQIAEACDVWWQAWIWIRKKVTPERNTLEAFDHAFLGMQSIFNWCQNFEVELGNAGIDDPKYHRLRIRYVQEFLDTFTDLDQLMRENFLRAEAEAYWRLGEIETAETKFKALIEANPDSAWGYIGWSDEYWLHRDSPKDYDRAEEILQRALERPNLQDRDVVLDRLKSLREKRGQ